jgi:hypothetical protein
MTDKEVVQKAIEKIAIETTIHGIDSTIIGGEEFVVINGMGDRNDRIDSFFRDMIDYDAENEWWDRWKVMGVVLSHDFAKAFWGEEFYAKLCANCDVYTTGLNKWQYHLQQMVLCDNPIDYLRKFILHLNKTRDGENL